MINYPRPAHRCVLFYQYNIEYNYFSNNQIQFHIFYFKMNISNTRTTVLFLSNQKSIQLILFMNFSYLLAYIFFNTRLFNETSYFITLIFVDK